MGNALGESAFAVKRRVDRMERLNASRTRTFWNDERDGEADPRQKSRSKRHLPGCLQG